MIFVKAWDNAGTAPDGWGSHIVMPWCDFEPVAGTYRLDLFKLALARRDRPCYVQLVFSMLDKVRNAPRDYTPGHHKRSLKLMAGGLVGEIPPYDAIWTAAYDRAVAALAAGLREHPLVAGYWHAAGWNAETQAAVAIRGLDWAAAAKPLLNSIAYYAFVTGSTMRAVEVWEDVPVYLPGAVAPGALWGTRRRDIIADCLRGGAGYMCCGLASDNSSSFGVGERAGLGMYDIGLMAERRGFEEGQRSSPAEPMELYWLIMRALHWRADFLNLYESISLPHFTSVAGLLPPPAARWIVFRDAEYPTQVTLSGGKRFGYSGEPGPWHQGILAEGLPAPERAGLGFGLDRWVMVAAEPLTLQLPGLPDGERVVTIWRPDGVQERNTLPVVGGRLTLPPGRYHRVDVMPAGTLTVEERLRSLERRVANLEGVNATPAAHATL